MFKSKMRVDDSVRLLETILLNRTLQSGSMRKTLHAIAKKHKCSDSLVGRAEQFLLNRLFSKAAVLRILINIKK